MKLPDCGICTPHTMAEEGPTAAQKQLSAESRAYCFGQDTSQLYARDDGKKAWRAEVPATDEEKQQAAAAEAEFRKEFSLGGLALRDVYDRHVEALTNLLKEGAAQHRAWYERRLARAHDAWANLKSIPEIFSAEHAFPEGLCDFVTYVHGQPHGTREVLKVPKPRGEPYEPGRVRGARTPPCSCPALSHVCSALSHSQVPASPASRSVDRPARARAPRSGTSERGAWATPLRALSQPLFSGRLSLLRAADW